MRSRRMKVLVVVGVVLLTIGSVLYGAPPVDSDRGPGIELTREILLGYTTPECPDELYNYSYLTDDVLFMDMARGEPMATGRDEVRAVLHRNYRQSFDAHKEDVRLIVGDGEAVMEWTVVGVHTGEYAGIPATGNEVAFPIVGVYALEDQWPYRIQHVRIYVMETVLLEQIQARGSSD